MWIRVEGATRPETTDTTSSKKWNYVRKDIHSEERTDEMTGETYTVWTWFELKVAKEDWELYKAVERNTANIDYIAMMSDIELEEDEEAEEDE